MSLLPKGREPSIGSCCGCQPEASACRKLASFTAYVSNRNWVALMSTPRCTCA